MSRKACRPREHLYVFVPPPRLSKFLVRKPMSSCLTQVCLLAPGQAFVKDALEGRPISDSAKSWPGLDPRRKRLHL